MLEAIGLTSAEQLFASIPDELRLQRPLNTPAALSEIELLDKFERLGQQNAAARRASFLGAGAYSHYVPTIVDHIISRPEMCTTYTPNQPKKSQGTRPKNIASQTLVYIDPGKNMATASR